MFAKNKLDFLGKLLFLTSLFFSSQIKDFKGLKANHFF